jgi:hypothetical protein
MKIKDLYSQVPVGEKFNAFVKHSHSKNPKPKRQAKALRKRRAEKDLLVPTAEGEVQVKDLE